MCPKSRSMIGPVAGDTPPATAGWSPDAPAAITSHAQATMSPMPRLTLALSSPSPPFRDDRNRVLAPTPGRRLAAPADPGYT